MSPAAQRSQSAPVYLAALQEEQLFEPHWFRHMHWRLCRPIAGKGWQPLATRVQGNFSNLRYKKLGRLIPFLSALFVFLNAWTIPRCHWDHATRTRNARHHVLIGSIVRHSATSALLAIHSRHSHSALLLDERLLHFFFFLKFITGQIFFHE